MSLENTIEYDERYNRWSVYEWDIYDKNSVLAGQTKKRFVDWFDSEENAKEAYPEASVGYRSAHNSYSHLPGEEDPVAGGMYLDDYDDGY